MSEPTLQEILDMIWEIRRDLRDMRRELAEHAEREDIRWELQTGGQQRR